jgi:hypothetical protein
MNQSLAGRIETGEEGSEEFSNIAIEPRPREIARRDRRAEVADRDHQRAREDLIQPVRPIAPEKAARAGSLHVEEERRGSSGQRVDGLDQRRRRIFRNDSFLISMIAESENSRGVLNCGGAAQLRYFCLRCLLTMLFLTVISCSAAWAQIEAGQTIAAIPTKEGELLVQNGTNNDVWLVADTERVSVDAEEALRVAGWIKEGKLGHYGNTGSVRFRRESDILVVTLGPEKAGKKELHLGEAEALHLAAALASGRQNVSEAGQ